MSTNIKPIRRALISVSDKTGIIEFGKGLHQCGVEILSTGGTASALRDAGVPVKDVSEHTGFPEMMDGRVKTLHPKIHGGILARRGQDDEAMAKQDITPIDLIVVNLYPFQQTIAKPGCTLSDAIENIDIGGPTMVRAAAKNHNDVTIAVSPSSYDSILKQLQEQKGIDQNTRFELSVRAFEHTAQYDAAIANYLGKGLNEEGSIEQEAFPNTFTQQFIKVQDMRYGENPHQNAAFYKELKVTEASVSSAVSHQGKALSFNNIADTDAALECVKQFSAPACVIVKHANPCGVAVAENLTTAYEKAFQTDPTSAFGGIIAFNGTLEAPLAKQIIDKQFVEVIIAPAVTDEALEVLATKKNVRVLSTGQWDSPAAALDFKRVNGGLLIQDRDLGMVNESELKTVTKRAPSETELQDLLFAWKIGKYVKSNAIVFAKDQQSIGIGAGQMSRVYSTKIACIKAQDEGLTVAGSVMASDAFFPFRDGIDQAAEAGIKAVIQPGGSIRDDEVIQAADEAGIAMVFTGMRHFRH